MKTPFILLIVCVLLSSCLSNEKLQKNYASDKIANTLPTSTIASELLIKDISKGNSFSFPIFESEDSLTSFKINAYLQLWELNLLIEKNKAYPFSMINKDGNEELYEGFKPLSSIHYKIMENTTKMLSLKISSCTSISAECWTNYYSFNPQNGDRYFLADFVDRNDKEKFKDVIAEKSKQYFIQQCEAFSDEISFSLQDSIIAKIDRWKKNNIIDKFFFSKDSIFINHDYILGYGFNRFDLPFSTFTGIEISAFSNLLNAHGKAALLTGDKLKDFHSVQEPQVYFGKIDNKHEIVLIFEESYGIYAYLKYGMGIELSGLLTEGIYKYEENYYPGNHFEFKKNGKNINGHWNGENQKGSINYTLNAMRK
jgi:hypothetical protein